MTTQDGKLMPAANYTLVIGDKNLSSWSLRPWLAMAHLGIPFEEERIRLRQPESKAAILHHSPSGKVPALKTNGLVVCDSLAILEYLAERSSGLEPLAGRCRGARTRPGRLGRDAFRLCNAPQRDADGSHLAPSPPRRSVLSSATISAGSWRSGASFVMPMAREVRSCSAPSRPLTPCMRRSRRASAPMASTLPRSAMTGARQTMSRRSSPCRRWRNGKAAPAKSSPPAPSV